jgi:hypothetical protein
MDDKCAVTRGDASNPWTSGDRPEHPAPGWGFGEAAAVIQAETTLRIDLLRHAAHPPRLKRERNLSRSQFRRHSGSGFRASRSPGPQRPTGSAPLRHLWVALLLGGPTALPILTASDPQSHDSVPTSRTVIGTHGIPRTETNLSHPPGRIPTVILKPSQRPNPATR